MRLLNFKTGSGSGLGIKTDKGIIDVYVASRALDMKDVPISVDALLAHADAGKAALQALLDKAGDTDGEWVVDESLMAFAPCVTHPEKIICVGLNYRKHAEESGLALPQTPVLFSKFNNSLAAHTESIPLPSLSEEYDYEAELAVVIGKEVKNVSEADALNAVFGYACANDISCRDLQKLTGQWLLGKTLDKFLPLGPYLVTADEVENPQNMEIKLWLNGELRQSSNTRDMIFSVAEIISYASKHFTLKPGDIISTGTPEGVILGRDPRVWMKPGDETAVEIGDLGRLTNTMSKGS